MLVVYYCSNGLVQKLSIYILYEKFLFVHHVDKIMNVTVLCVCVWVKAVLSEPDTNQGYVYAKAVRYVIH